MKINIKNFLLLLILIVNSMSEFYSQQISFSNVAPDLGIVHTSMKDFFVGGLSFCDFNNDGLDDLCFSNINNVSIQILKNDVTTFTDVTASWNLSVNSRSQTLIWADFDNDGDKDLYVTILGKENKFFRNDGNNNFTDITMTSGIIIGNSNSTAAAWADYDNDGWLDLYIGTRTDGEGNYLFHNNQDGTFTDVTIAAGVQNIGKKALAISFIDYDADGWQDIYIADDLRLGNTLFRNNGDGTFTDVSVASHSDLVMDAMGIAIGDYDDNDALDMYISNLPLVGGNYLLKNNADGTFSEVAASLGVSFNKVSWGVNFFDYDNDTDLDLFVCASDGFFTGNSGRENILYNNNGDGTFTKAIGSGLDVDTSYSYGSAVGDYNNDGWLDLAVLNANGTKSELWKNNGGTNNWIKILLQGTVSNRDGVGSIMEFYVQGKKFIRSTHCGISYQSQDSFTNTIGIGTATLIDSIVIKWQSKIVDVLTNLNPNQSLIVIEGSHPRQQPVVFSEIASSMGINNSYNTDFFAGGISFADYNNDGLDDISTSSASGEKIFIYKNKTISFKKVNGGSISDTHRSKSVVWVDYDNDKDKDLFISNEDGPNKLYQRAGSTYLDVTLSAGLSTTGSASTGVCWGDYDNDGYLDLYIGTRNDLEGNYLYHNNGDGTFTDVTSSAGVDNFGNLTLTAVWIDYNNDSWLDIYCANDLMKGNTLFKNNGDGTFTDVSLISGAGLSMACMGIAIGDYNNDGWQDLYLSNSPDGNRMLKNNQDGTFSEVSSSLGLNVGKICWGANFLDFDNDGDQDLFISVSDGPSGRGDPDRQNILFKNNGNETFTEVSLSVLGVDSSYSYGNAIGDFNNDGYPDIVVLNANGTKSALYKNNGGTNNWLKIKLIGTLSNRDGIGSTIEIYSGDKKQVKTSHLGISYESQNSFIQLFGLGTAAVIDSIIVKWPSGNVTELYGVTANQILNIRESNSMFVLEKHPQDDLTQFKLFQNYPNPFNPTTKIKYSIPKVALNGFEEAKVTLKIYDILGNEVATLVNELHSPGFYEIEFNASDLASGLYLYKLQVGSFVETKKLMFLK